MILEQKYKDIIYQRIEEMTRKGNSLVVAYSTLALRLLYLIYKDKELMHNVVSMDHIAYCAKSIVGAGIDNIIRFDIFPFAPKDTTADEERLQEHGVNSTSLVATDCIYREGYEPNPGERIHVMNTICRDLVCNTILPYLDYPHISYKIDGVSNNVLDSIEYAALNYGSFNCYSNTVYGVKYLTFILHSTTDQTFNKVLVWHDRNKGELLFVPMSAIIVPNDINYIKTLLSGTYNNVVWDRVCESASQLENQNDIKSTLITLANYLFSFERFQYFIDSLDDCLRNHVTWKLGSMQIAERNLHAICGSKELVKEIKEELLQAYSMNFRLKHNDSLVKNEQQAQLLFEKVNRINQDDNEVSQKTWYAIKNATNEEDILLSCYIASGKAMGYGVAPLLRALDGSNNVTIDNNSKILFIHKWLDTNTIKGALDVTVVLQLENWRTAYCSSVNDFDVPTQLARFVLSVLRRSFSILKRNDIPEDFLDGILAFTYSKHNIVEINDTKLQVKDRKVFVEKNGQWKSAIGLLVSHRILQKGSHNLISIPNELADRELLYYIGIPEDVAKQIVHTAAECVAPLKTVPLPLYKLVLNKCFFPYHDLISLKEKMVNVNVGLDCYIQRLKISSEQGIAPDTDTVYNMIVEYASKLKDYLIPWNMVLDTCESMQSTNSEKFFDVQRTIQLINLKLRLLQSVVVLNRLDYASQLCKDVMDNLQYKGMPVYDTTQVSVIVGMHPHPAMPLDKSNMCAFLESLIKLNSCQL